MRPKPETNKASAIADRFLIPKAVRVADKPVRPATGRSFGAAVFFPVRKLAFGFERAILSAQLPETARLDLPDSRSGCLNLKWSDRLY
jgi:hypothetical protein